MFQRTETFLPNGRRLHAARRRTACLSLCGLLLACTPAWSQGPGRTGGASLAADARQPLYGVRAAGWDETIDAADLNNEADTTGLPQVLQVAGEHDPLVAVPDSTSNRVQPGDDTAAAAAGDASANTEWQRYLKDAGPEPRPAMDWTESAGGIDPGATLRDWAENAGLLLGFVMVSLWLVRQWLGKKTFDAGPTTHMRTIESLSLPQRCRVHLVDIQGRRVIVTTDAAGVKNVTVLPDRFAALMEDGEAEAAPVTAAVGERREADVSGSWNTLRDSRLA